MICRIFHKLGEKKSSGGQNYPHFKQHQSTLKPSPPTPTPSEITKKSFHESTTPLMHHPNPPPLQNPFLFGDNHQEIHDKDLKSILNLPTFQTLQTNPNPTMVKPLTLQNDHTTLTPVPKQCKTESHFSIPQLPDANMHRWGTNYIPSTPLFSCEQHDLGGMDFFFNTSGGSVSGNGGGARVAEGTSDRNNEVMTFDRVGFNHMLLPTI